MKSHDPSSKCTHRCRRYRAGCPRRVPTASSIFIVLVLSFLLTASTVAAKGYRVPILVDTEDDILELEAVGGITREERDLLLRLLDAPLDINEASRDELYELPGLTYDLVDRILTAREEAPFPRVASLRRIPGLAEVVFRQIRPFLEYVPLQRDPKKRRPWDISGSLRYVVTDEIEDTDTDRPEMYLRGRMQGLGGVVKAGFAVTLENGIGAVKWRDAWMGDVPADVWKVDISTRKLQCDRGQGVYTCGPGSPEHMVYDSESPLDQYLVTDGEQYRVPWPKIYVSAERGRWRVIAGSYTIGFGQRLVLDNTGWDKPHGFEGDHSVYDRAQPKDDLTDEEEASVVELGLGHVYLRDGFMGAAGAYDVLLGGRLSLELSPFFSWWAYDANSYDLEHKDRFTGDRNGYDIVSRIRGTGLYRKHYFKSIPQAYDELLGGANVSLKWGGRSHVGITGYGAQVSFRLHDPSTVFRTSSDYPVDRTVFGAFGLDAAVEVGGDTTLYAEVATTDRVSPEAMAAIVRCVWERRSLEIDVSTRYLGDDYDNPHARAVSNLDQWMGSPDRGEFGIRANVQWRVVRWLRLHLAQDIWRAAYWNDPYDSDRTKTHFWRNETFFQVEGYPVDWWSIGVFGSFRDRDLETVGWRWTDANKDREGVDSFFNGERWRLGLQTVLTPLEWMSLHLYYRIWFFHDEDLSLKREYQKGHYTYLKIKVDPASWIGILVRVKYSKDELVTKGVSTSRWNEYIGGHLGVDFQPIRGLIIGGLCSIGGYLGRNDPGEAPANVYGWRTQVSYKF